MAGTPPTQPTYNVHLTTQRISQIIESVFSNPEIISITESDQSFNNRIYFVSVRSAPSQSETDAPLELVLKVNGRFFDGRKVENEAGCLLMLDRHGSHIPVPRVVAWSTDGLEVQSATQVLAGRDGLLRRRGGSPVQSFHPWVLMTRLPG